MRTPRRTRIAAVALATAAAFVTLSAATPDRKPRLVVIVVVDQMRADYIDRFASQWTGGLKRLVEEGAWFRQANYPFATRRHRQQHPDVRLNGPGSAAAHVYVLPCAT